MDELDRWKGKIALVTGASSGIGDAIARALIKFGMKTAVCARRKDRLDALAKDMAGEAGEVLVLQCDMEKEADIKALFPAIRKKWGQPLDVLVNNAGTGYRKALAAGDSKGWAEMLNVNILAVAIATREALQEMKDKDEGQIVNIGSIYGHQDRVPMAGMYTATKNAVRAMTNTLRTELQGERTKIRIGAVSPGLVATEMRPKMTNGEFTYESYFEQFHPLLPKDVANAVLYMLSTPHYAEVHDILIGPMYQAL